MNRLASLPRFLAQRRALMQPKRNAGGHGHHEVHNPGPPITYDYCPVPHQPHAKVYAEIQQKFNMQLLGGVALFCTAIATALYTNLWIIPETSAPESYRYRNKPGYNYERDV